MTRLLISKLPVNGLAKDRQRRFMKKELEFIRVPGMAAGGTKGKSSGGKW
jgi:hypothetical protein